MSEKTASRTASTNFFGLLTLLFIGLKLTGYIEWSWWWVLSPFWLPLVVLLAVLLIAGAIACMLK